MPDLFSVSTPAALRVAGVDEAGRGPLAGPVVAAAVILPEDLSGLDGIADSKALSARRRERLAQAIRLNCLVGVGVAEPAEIDRLNVLHATLAATRRAVCALPHSSDLARIDGNRLPPGLPCPAEAIVGGDASDPAISAASIIAKTVRDHLMRLVHRGRDRLFAMNRQPRFERGSGEWQMRIDAGGNDDRIEAFMFQQRVDAFHPGGIVSLENIGGRLRRRAERIVHRCDACDIG